MSSPVDCSVLIPKARKIVGDHGPSSLAKRFDTPGFHVGQTKASGQNQNAILFRNSMFEMYCS
jgi:hypothetical protein